MSEYSIEFDDKQVRRVLKRLRGQIPQLQRMILARFAETVIRISQDKYLNAAPGDASHLHSRTGHLSSSLRYWFRGNNTVYVGTQVKYAAIHEFSGIIEPVNASYLRFQINGRWVMTKRVVMPKRPYVAPAIDDLFSEGRAARIANFTLQEFIRRAA